MMSSDWLSTYARESLTKSDSSYSVRVSRRSYTVRRCTAMRSSALTPVTTHAATIEMPCAYATAACDSDRASSRAISRFLRCVKSASSPAETPTSAAATMSVSPDRLRTSLGATSRFSQYTSLGSGAAVTVSVTWPRRGAIAKPSCCTSAWQLLSVCARRQSRLPFSVSKMMKAAPVGRRSSACSRAISPSSATISCWIESILPARPAGSGKPLARSASCCAVVSRSSMSSFFHRSKRRTYSEQRYPICTCATFPKLFCFSK
mmetsp:Transcript_9465/g.29889  ORF Transcript_9465/g.29889 Transcript_9465/m.29889 type:complete len:262 (+) Transcript_9465:840-1625(+)